MILNFFFSFVKVKRALTILNEFYSNLKSLYNAMLVLESFVVFQGYKSSQKISPIFVLQIGLAE